MAHRCRRCTPAWRTGPGVAGQFAPAVPTPCGVIADELLPTIVEDHLARNEDLTLELAPMPACPIVAPLPITQAAIGNLLSNAI